MRLEAVDIYQVVFVRTPKNDVFEENLLVFSVVT